jgi:hypothetical protein
VPHLPLGWTQASKFDAAMKAYKKTPSGPLSLSGDLRAVVEPLSKAVKKGKLKMLDISQCQCDDKNITTLRNAIESHSSKYGPLGNLTVNLNTLSTASQIALLGLVEQGHIARLTVISASAGQQQHLQNLLGQKIANVQFV